MANDKKKNPIKFIVSDDMGKVTNTCRLKEIEHSELGDCGFEGSFYLYYFDSKSHKKWLGICRIIKVGKTLGEGLTPLPIGEFAKLPEEYCSLSRESSYYGKIMEFDKDTRENILTSLRDCAFNNEIYEANKDVEAMKGYLLLGIDINRVTHSFPIILGTKIDLTPYYFRYSLNQSKETKIDLEVSSRPRLPSNMHVLIDRNRDEVGKAAILSGIADQLTKNKEESPIIQPGILDFISEAKLESKKFTKSVSIVFNAYNDTRIVHDDGNTEDASCQYVLLNTLDGKSFKTPEEFKNDFVKSIEFCLDGKRKQHWLDSMKVLNTDRTFREYELDQMCGEADIEEIKKFFDGLSPEYKMIFFTITKLVELVDQKTLVLIEDPVSTAHSPAFLPFIRVLSDLLIKRDSVALIAAESPIII
ncbi:MAG: hypothetical protein JJV97_05310 [SAR324 cluster bacterium]|nr:hypothetical protein [SAR324 cluster bacterium]